MKRIETDDLDGEIWKPIQNWDGYEISNMGRIKSYKYWDTKPNEIVRIIAGSKNDKGYRRLILSDNQRRKHVIFAQLVALHFIGVRPKGLVVCHKNGIKTDDRAENLEYKTQKENIHDKFKHGTMPLGEKISTSKLTETQVREIRRSSLSLIALAEKFHVSRSTIYSAKSYQLWKHVLNDEILPNK